MASLRNVSTIAVLGADFLFLEPTRGSSFRRRASPWPAAPSMARSHTAARAGKSRPSPSIGTTFLAKPLRGLGSPLWNQEQCSG